MNPLLDRWIKSSLSKHFRAICTTYGVDFLTSQEIRDTGSKSKWVELRVIGPEYKQLGKNDYRICVEIDLLVTVTPEKSNLLELDNLTGLLSVNCADIQITNQTSDHLFCLALDADIDKNIRVIPYGQASGFKQRRASVMAIYEIETTLV